MKKFTMIGLVIVILAFSAIPVLAAKPNNGHGNGASAGQSSNGGDRNQNKGQTNNRGHGNRFTNQNERGNSNHPGKRMRTPFYLQGTIASIDTATMTITVTVVHGNAQVKQFVGAVDMPITIVFTDTTQIFKITQTGEVTETVSTGDETESVSISPSVGSTEDGDTGNRVPITFADLKVGDIVAIHGNVVETLANNVVTRTFDARLVTVYVREVTGQPKVEGP